MRLHGIPLVAALAVTLGASAQEKPAPPNPQAAVEPPSGPGKGQAYLKRFEGEWSVERIFHGRGGETMRAAGTCTQRMVAEGRFLESRFTFTQDGKTTTGVGISGYDPATDIFTTAWYDSRSTRMSIRASRPPFDGREIVLYGVPLGPGQDRVSKSVAQIDEGDRRIVHRQFAIAPDGSERLFLELILTRKPKERPTI